MQFFSRAPEQPGGASRRPSVVDEMSVEGQVLSFLSEKGYRFEATLSVAGSVAVVEDCREDRRLAVCVDGSGGASLGDCPGPPGRLTGLRVLHRTLSLYGAFVRPCRALNNPFGRFSPRADTLAVREQRGLERERRQAEAELTAQHETRVRQKAERELQVQLLLERSLPVVCM